MTIQRPILRLVLFGAALAAVLFLARRVPRAQTIHYVLGDGAPRVEEVDARWEEQSAAHGDWSREVTFRYAPGSAPRVVTHEPNMANGDYTVEIDLLAASPGPISEPRDRRSLQRRVTLAGGVTSIDLTSSVPR